MRFRHLKVLGTACGLWDGALLMDQRQRESMFFTKTAKAVVIHGRGRAALEEVQIPQVKPGDALIRVAYEGVCRTDLEVLEGSLSYYKTGVAKYPIVPGHEFSGRVVKIGPNVKHLREGDAVVVECIQSCGQCAACRRQNWIGCAHRAEVGVIGRDGGYSEYMVTSGRFVHKVPDDLDLKKAALCEPLAVVLKGLKRLGRTWASDGAKSCLVVGVGPIGHLCARLLAVNGHKVAVYDRNPLRLSYFQCTEVKTIEALDDFAQFDAIIEATGDPEALDTILQRSVPGTTILLLGVPYAKREFNFEQIVVYDKTIIGSVGSSAQEFKEAIELLPRLELDVFLKKVFPLEKYAAAWQATRAGQHLKVLLKVDAQLD